MIVDKVMKSVISSNSTKKGIKQLRTIYSTPKTIATFKDTNAGRYSFDNILIQV